jgi:hypothetical protein
MNVELAPPDDPNLSGEIGQLLKRPEILRPAIRSAAVIDAVGADENVERPTVSARASARLKTIVSRVGA